MAWFARPLPLGAWSPRNDLHPPADRYWCEQFITAMMTTILPLMCFRIPAVIQKNRIFRTFPPLLADLDKKELTLFRNISKIGRVLQTVFFVR
jgi:hypothetical protein